MKSNTQEMPYLVWFTGLPSSGKTTVATQVEALLLKAGHKVFLLDGDDLRSGLNNDLGFSEEDRNENIRRAGEVAKLFLSKDYIVLAAFISPFEFSRNQIRKSLPENKFIEVFVNCPVEVCEERDVKGLYKKARTGETQNFTGVSSPYHPPSAPEIELRTDILSIEESAKIVSEFVLTEISKEVEQFSSKTY